MAITASEAGRDLSSLISQVVNDHQPVEIRSEHGDAVLLSLADYEALQETAFFFRIPDNASALVESLEEVRRSDDEAHDLA